MGKVRETAKHHTISFSLIKRDGVADVRAPTLSPVAHAQFTKQEIASLSHALSQSNLEKQSWNIDENGRFTAENGQVIFKPGFKTAWEK